MGKYLDDETGVARERARFKENYNILTKKNKRALDKVIAADPTLRKNKDDMIKLSKKIQDKISDIEKSNPKLAQSLRKAYL